MKEQNTRCNVCGCTNVVFDLLDNCFVCTECATQQKDMQYYDESEVTKLTHKTRPSQNFRKNNSDKFNKISSVWYKWHAYNYILCGMADQLISLGAKPTFKMKVLWIWSSYIKKYKNKNETDLNKNIEAYNNKEKELDEDIMFDSCEKDPSAEPKNYSDLYSIHVITKRLLLAILYIALNFDGDDIQMSHLLKYIREDKLSFYDCQKFLPKEFNPKDIPFWDVFINITYFNINHMQYNWIRKTIYLLLKELDLGTLLVPDLKQLIEIYVKELCLPNEFKNLVISLMGLEPYKIRQNGLRLSFEEICPDFESIAMSYVLMVFKICFGLDDDYEIRLSDVVDQINHDRGYPKSFKLGSYSDLTDRLFSFRQWCTHYQLKRNVLCKYYLPMARKYNLHCDEYVYMEHLRERDDTKKLKNNIYNNFTFTMNIIHDKILQKNASNAISKSEFPVSLTPIFSYTEFIIPLIQDTEQRLLLSEDFTQYSLQYVCRNLEDLVSFNGFNDGVIGVSENRKKFEINIKGFFKTYFRNLSSRPVFVRNCENKTWLKTKPPTSRHLMKAQDENRESDHGYDSNENNISQKENSTYLESEKVFESFGFDEESGDCNIFDFDDLKDYKDKTIQNSTFENLHFHVDTENSYNSGHDMPENIDDKTYVNDTLLKSPEALDISVLSNDKIVLGSPTKALNISILNKQQMIEKIITTVCKQRKIPIPNAYKVIESRKRKLPPLEFESKRRNTSNVRKDNISADRKNIFSAYQAILEKDILKDVSEQVKYAMENSLLNHEKSSITNISLDNLNQNPADELEICDQIHSDENINIDSASHILNKSNETDQDKLLLNNDDIFDEQIYDVKQLYLDFCNKEFNMDILETEYDKEINEILERKIHQGNSSSQEYESEDDIPLSKWQVERSEKKIKNNIKYSKLQPLITIPQNVCHINYWVRHYYHRSTAFRDCNSVFSIEMMKNFTKSFSFVLNECAAIIECRPFVLYNYLVKLERQILRKC